jgi:Tropinone reductase 1
VTVGDVGPVAVVTGASSGIGAATAVALGAAGMRVVLVGRRLEALAEVAARVGPGAMVEVLDLADPGAAAATGVSLAERFPDIHAVVNCAGETINRRAENLDATDLQRLFAVNTFSPYALLQQLFSTLRAGMGASVVNVVSVSALQGVAAQTAYSAAKGALVSLTRSLAAEWGRYGVRVNGVAPGIIHTPMSERAYDNKDYRAHIARNVPLGRWGAPDDLAGVIAFLCSDAARYVTGQIIAVDGGLSSLYWLSTVGLREPTATGDSERRGAMNDAG